MRAAVAVIIQQGDNPDCVHMEKIVGSLGECTKCHRIKQYPDNEITDQVFTPRNERGESWTENWTWL